MVPDPVPERSRRAVRLFMNFQLKKMKITLIFLLLITLTACTQPPQKPYHELRLAQAPLIENQICGSITKAALVDQIPTHEDKDTITWYTLPIPDHLDTAYILQNLKHAFTQWQDNINIPIKRSHHIHADIHIEFDWMDGIGGILGIADFPGSNTPQILTFDLYDISSMAERTDYDFFTIALHEIGHTLGIPHLAIPDAVMWPAYRQHFRSPAAPDKFKAKDRYNITDSFIDKHNRRFIYIKKKTIPISTLTSAATNSFHSAGTSREKGTG